ncbi:MAG: Peptidylprolyl isomerase [Myxococcaceae bacterium]|nr:Peptidylprolyl isomerase [Myxococcaceae bacterium]
MPWKFLLAGLPLACLLACSPPKPRHVPEADTSAPEPTGTPAEQTQQWQAAKRTFDQRCVVCHGCYDSPCQLNLSSFEGIERGATKQKVYDGARLLAVPPTRLHVDGQNVDEWRKQAFYPVLPEGAAADPRTALLTRMLELKRRHPLVLDGGKLPEEFEIGLQRQEVCPKPNEFEAYEKDHPSWGMPYALPGLAEPDHQALSRWVAAGTPHDEPAPLATSVSESIARWEEFMNHPGIKEQLVARYIYEHLFLASLYFEGLDDHVFFRMVRSETAPGKPIKEIATRRPFDDPGVRPVYYRLLRRVDTRLAKTHMPYPLSDKRLARYRELFIEPNYLVVTTPDYDPQTSANPFAAFSSLPVRSRYRFMLEEAQFTMAGFIKGPVCRGQIALDVIEDRFWIAFVDPESPIIEREAELLAGSAQDLALPAEQGSNGLLVTWRKYAKHQKRYLEAKSQYLSDLASSPKLVTLQQIWDGDGKNDNAALTVMRHFDSATVVKGLVGGDPKTAWVVGYALLERIHYLLVAGFDVFGNVGHQLHSRMYMDFLRMEAEFNFLTFLPKARRGVLMESWYRDTGSEVKDQVYGKFAHFDQESGIPYKTAEPEHELFEQLTERVSKVLVRRNGLGTEPSETLREALTPLALLEGMAATLMPETSFLEVRGKDGSDKYFTILRDSAHTNVAHLFQEDDRRRPTEDQLTLLRGLVGAYPNSLYSVNEQDVPRFVRAVSELNSSRAYDSLRERFGVRRTDARFWAYSDRLHAASRELAPLESGLFDYNRLDGR